MVATPVMSQQISAREDVGLDSDEGNWGTMQIAAPAIVGGGLLLILSVAFIVWRRRATRDRPYAKYRQAPNDWLTKIESVFVPWRKRQRVRRSSAFTIAESMRTPGSMVDSRRAHRSTSSDSQIPLTTTTYDFVYPPKCESSPIPKRHHTLRWWWLFGSRPKEVKSEEPNSRWRVDDTDGSSSGHGSHGREEPRVRYDGGGLEVLHEFHEDVEVDGVIRIGRDFTSIPSTVTPLAQPEHSIEYARPVRSMSPIVDHPQRTVRTPVPVTNAVQGHPGTPQLLSSANRGPPPSYNVSQTHTLVQCPSAANTCGLAPAEPSYLAVPLTGHRAVYYSSPRGFHGRELSSDSVVVAAQQPMAVATSLY